MPFSEEELDRFRDEASGYYVGLWNILVKHDVPSNIIIDAAINNLLAVLDQYMSTENKMELLKTVTETIQEEHLASTEVMQ